VSTATGIESYRVSATFTFFFVHRMRQVRLSCFVVAELDGAVLEGAICLDDFDGDGEDEVAVGTVTGRISIFKYQRDRDQLVLVQSFLLGDSAILAVVSGAGIGGITARCLVAIDVLGTVHFFTPEYESGALQHRAARSLPGNLTHVTVGNVRGSSQRYPSIIVATGDGVILAIDPTPVLADPPQTPPPPASNAMDIQAASEKKNAEKAITMDKKPLGGGHFNASSAVKVPDAREASRTSLDVHRTSVDSRDACKEPAASVSFAAPAQQRSRNDRGDMAGMTQESRTALERIELRIRYGCNVDALISGICPLECVIRGRPHSVVAVASAAKQRPWSVTLQRLPVYTYVYVCLCVCM
jgi:hypothetical protein